jgi:hypothetical protein
MNIWLNMPSPSIHHHHHHHHHQQQQQLKQHHDQNIKNSHSRIDVDIKDDKNVDYNNHDNQLDSIDLLNHNVIRSNTSVDRNIQNHNYHQNYYNHNQDLDKEHDHDHQNRSSIKRYRDKVSRSFYDSYEAMKQSNVHVITQANAGTTDW